MRSIFFFLIAALGLVIYAKAQTMTVTDPPIFKSVSLVPGGVQPTCDSTKRGVIFFVPGALGVLDTISVCRKSAIDVYAWVSMTGGL